MTAAKAELKAECVRLRLEERLSVKDIHRRTGASVGSVSTWVRDYPRTPDERKRRRPVAEVAAALIPGSYIASLVHLRKLSRLQVGKVSETAVLLRLLAYGYNVFGSVFDGDTADWVVEVPLTGRIVRVQVKTARTQAVGAPTVDLTHGRSTKRGARRYGPDAFDFIVGYDIFSDKAYVWAAGEVAHLSSAVSVTAEHAERWDKLEAVNGV